jgi:hypothetical protein
MEERYGNWRDYLVCVGIAISLGAKLPMPNRRRERYWRRHPKEMPPTTVTPVKAEPAHNGQLSAGDTWTILGVLLGVLFVIALPPLYLKIPAFALVCGGLAWLAHRSHWVSNWTLLQKNLAAVLVVLICSGIAVPQFISQCKFERASEHTVLAFDEPIYLKPQLLPIQAGKIPTLNLGLSNVGDFNALEVRQDFYIVVVPYSGLHTDDAFPKYYSYLRTSQAPAISSLPAHSNPHAHAYLTYTGQALGEAEAEGLEHSTSVVYVVGATTWRDKSGSYETHFSRYLFREIDGSYNWHIGADDQKELKLCCF